MPSQSDCFQYAHMSLADCTELNCTNFDDNPPVYMSTSYLAGVRLSGSKAINKNLNKPRVRLIAFLLEKI